VKNRFQNVPYKRNLQRYNAPELFRPGDETASGSGNRGGGAVGLCTLESS
jgi:hypothetical protein